MCAYFPANLDSNLVFYQCALNISSLVRWNEGKSTLNIQWKNWCWSSSALASWWEESTHWETKKQQTNKEPDPGKYWRQEQKAWQRMGWLDGISNSMEWVWASFRTWWWTGQPGILKFIGSQEVRHDWATEHQKPGRVFLYRWRNLNRAILNFWRRVEHNFLARSLAATRLEYFVFTDNFLCNFSGWCLGVRVPHNGGCCLS